MNPSPLNISTPPDAGSSGVQGPPPEIGDRAASFADRCIRAALALPDNGVAWELQRQMVRAAASIGANLAERRGVITRSEFTYKASLALREAHETCYWLTRIVNADLLPEARLAPLMEEGHQIVSILTATVKKPRSQGPGK